MPAGLRRRFSSTASSSGGRSTMIKPSAPAAAASLHEMLRAIGMDGIVIAHQHDGGLVVALCGIRAPAPGCGAMLAPALSARRLDACTAGPSAMGSVNGMPSSITSAPAPGSSSRIAREVSRSGSPAVMKGTKAARPCAFSSAKRWAMRHHALISFLPALRRRRTHPCRRGPTGRRRWSGPCASGARPGRHAPGHARIPAPE